MSRTLASAERPTALLASIFPHADDDVLATLGETAVWQTYGPQDLIVQQNAPFLGVYAVCGGLVAVGRFSPTHKRWILRVLKSREFLGLEECFIGERRVNLCYARALVASELLFFPHERFVQFLKGCASCLFEVCGLLSQRVADLDDKVTRATAEGPLSNLADLLLNSRQTDEGRPALALWGLAPSRQLLAAILGISEQTVLKLLRELRRKRIISTSDERIEILDERALARLALAAEE